MFENPGHDSGVFASIALSRKEGEIVVSVSIL